MRAFIVNTCDEWNSYTSFRLVGVFTSRKKLNTILVAMLKKREIEFDDESDIGKDIENTVYCFTERELHDKLKYLSVQIININERQ